MVMGLSLKPEHLRRYANVARLLYKYGGEQGANLASQAGWQTPEVDAAGDRAAVIANGETDADPKPEQLADDLEALGPTFIKLGQLLSTRSDLLSQPYLDALSRLQDDIEPFDFADVERIIEEDLKAKPSRIFSEIDRRPVAAASLGQVHRALLRDGRAVVVKVQRPGIGQGIVTDLDALAEMAQFLDKHTEVGRRYGFERVLAELRKSLLEELDYRLEARNLQTLGENMLRFKRIIVPQPFTDFCSSRVITMQLVEGQKITDLSPVVLIEHDRTALAEELSQAYLKQILIDGFFHADPHPGNVLLTQDGRLGLIDLGMVARLTPKLQEALVRLLLAVSEGRGDDAADIAIAVGERTDDADEEAFRRCAAEFVGRHHNLNVKDMSAGKVVQELFGIAAETGIRLPQEFTMIGKALLNLDIITRTLDPEFDPHASIRRNANDLMRQRMQEKFSKGNTLSALLEASDFMQRLPDRANRILENIAANKFSIEVDAIDEAELIKGLQKIANRITVGLVIAAMIVGAALLMRVETRFTIAGYPGLAMLLFAAAIVAGAMLVYTILKSDRK